MAVPCRQTSDVMGVQLPSCRSRCIVYPRTPSTSTIPNPLPVPRALLPSTQGPGCVIPPRSRPGAQRGGAARADASRAALAIGVLAVEGATSAAGTAVRLSLRFRGAFRYQMGTEWEGEKLSGSGVTGKVCFGLGRVDEQRRRGWPRTVRWAAGSGVVTPEELWQRSQGPDADLHSAVATTTERGQQDTWSLLGQQRVGKGPWDNVTISRTVRDLDGVGCWVLHSAVQTSSCQYCRVM